MGESIVLLLERTLYFSQLEIVFITTKHILTATPILGLRKMSKKGSVTLLKNKGLNKKKSHLTLPPMDFSFLVSELACGRVLG